MEKTYVCTVCSVTWAHIKYDHASYIYSVIFARNVIYSFFDLEMIRYFPVSFKISRLWAELSTSTDLVWLGNSVIRICIQLSMDSIPVWIEDRILTILKNNLQRSDENCLQIHPGRYL